MGVLKSSVYFLIDCERRREEMNGKETERGMEREKKRGWKRKKGGIKVR